MRIVNRKRCILSAPVRCACNVIQFPSSAVVASSSATLSTSGNCIAFHFDIFSSFFVHYTLLFSSHTSPHYDYYDLLISMNLQVLVLFIRKSLDTGIRFQLNGRADKNILPCIGEESSQRTEMLFDVFLCAQQVELLSVVLLLSCHRYCRCYLANWRRYT